MKVMGLNPGYPLKYFLFYMKISYRINQGYHRLHPNLNPNPKWGLMKVSCYVLWGMWEL